MSEFENTRSNRISYASPWLFATAGLLLALIISVFAINNYRREKVVMVKVLVQEGQAVINLTASAARGATRDLFKNRIFEEKVWIDAIQQVILQGSEHEEIVDLFMVDEKGKILAHNDQEKISKFIDSDTLNYLGTIKIQNPADNSRVLVEVGNGKPLFQIANLFYTFGFMNEKPFQKRDGSREHVPRMMKNSNSSPRFERFFQGIANKRFFLVVNLDMTDYQDSVKKQLVQIIILSVVLLLVGLGGFISMITLQGFKGTQLRLKRMSAFTDVLISSMPVGIIALNSEELIQTCNRSACEMLNLAIKTVKGKKPTNLLPSELARFIEKEKYGKGGDSDVLDIKIEGVVKTLAVERVTVEDSTRNQSGTMLLIQDMTTQKKLELEIRRNERHTALGKMAAGVAHELRNPLSSIKGLAILLRNKNGDDKSSNEATDIMISEVERLDRSIRELLDYARPKNLDLKNIDLNKILRKAVMLIETDAKASGVEIINNPASEGCHINGDKDRLTQVFLNLFLNSIQAMPDGGTLSVNVSKEQEAARIEVKDNGVGVEPELKEKIFDPYFTTKNEGTGLGLSLSVKIVEDHKGSVIFESQKGQGTMVTVYLPV